MANAPMIVRMILLTVLTIAAASCTGSEGVVPIDQTAWRLVELRSDTDMIPLEEGTEVTFSVDLASGSVFGFSGCQSYVFAADIGTDRIEIEYSGHDLVGCPPGGGDQQRDLFVNLERSARYGVANDQLTLLDSSGEILAVFSRETYEPFSDRTDITTRP